MLGSLVDKKKRIYPLFALLCSIFIFIVGLLLVKEEAFYIFLGLIIIMYFIFGYAKVFLKVLLFGIPFSIFVALLALITSSALHAYQNGLRFFVLILSSVLTLSIEPVDLVRSLNQIHFPRPLTLGLLISLRFLTIMKEEIKRIQMAMKTRGIKVSAWKLGLVFRAFVIPLLSRVISISDTLSISLETRHFSMDQEHSVYKEVLPVRRDIIFLSLSVLICVLSFIYWKFIV